MSKIGMEDIAIPTQVKQRDSAGAACGIVHCGGSCGV